ncbi:MAG: hypothetical protein JOZ53_06130 [Planctomycetaceae bacterium]|nr:hypothetical protein [Planctomycetaceae bacterium]
MSHRPVLRPDLNACALEDRCLPAPLSLVNSFLSFNLVTNQMVVPGTSPSSGGGGGNSSYPGPSFYFVTVGLSVNNGSSGGSTGSLLSVFQFNGTLLGTLGGGGGGGGGGSPASPNGTSGSGGTSNVGGYSSSFSSGYNTSLGATNNYGMGTSTLGTIPVHTYGGGGDVQDAPGFQGGTGPSAPSNSSSNPNPSQGIGGLPSATPGVNTIGPAATLNLWKNLLGKSPAIPTMMPTGPAPSLAPSTPGPDRP